METPVRTTALAFTILLALSACTKSPDTAAGTPDKGEISKMLHQDISQVGDGTAQPHAPAPAVPAQQRPTASATQSAAKPAFDCAKASTHVEQLVCSDQDLAAMDARLGMIYSGLVSDPDLKLKSEQAAWLKNTRNRCETIQCLRDAYKARIDDLEPVYDYMNKPAEFR